ncbi:MAG: hypothetical protein V4506_00830 [Bacteroidota bacterium]
MKQTFLLLALFTGLSLFSQKDKKPEEKVKVIYKDATVETDDYKVYIEDAVAVATQSKFKMKVFNKTNDYLLVKPTEIVFMAEGKTLNSKDRTFVVAPNDEAYLVIDYKDNNLQVDKYSLDIKGIYKASAGGKIDETPNFQLPPSKNDFTTGSFTCTLKKSDSKTDKSVARFECAYNGDGVGVINPYKAVAVMPNGADNANSKKNKAMVLEKGVVEDFTMVFMEVKDAGDMQKKPINIKWNETFRESKLILLKGVKIDLEKDSPKVEEKK